MKTVPCSRFPFSFKVVNVVSSTRADHQIDIEALSMSLQRTQYEPGLFSGLVYRRLRPKATIIMFSSGKIASTGTKSEEDSRESILSTVSEMSAEEGTHFSIEKIRIENVVAVSDVGSKIDLEKTVESGINVIYEPEIFPAGVYKMSNNVSVLVFASGKLVSAGSKSEREAKLAMESMITTLQKHDCLRGC